MLEMRNEALQAVVLPLVMAIIERQDGDEFANFTLPALK